MTGSSVFVEQIEQPGVKLRLRQTRQGDDADQLFELEAGMW